ncbi:hypothetical protein ABK040_006766 [Willaertia magna]
MEENKVDEHLLGEDVTEILGKSHQIMESLLGESGELFDFSRLPQITRKVKPVYHELLDELDYFVNDELVASMDVSSEEGRLKVIEKEVTFKRRLEELTTELNKFFKNNSLSEEIQQEFKEILSYIEEMISIIYLHHKDHLKSSLLFARVNEKEGGFALENKQLHVSLIEQIIRQKVTDLNDTSQRFYKLEKLYKQSSQQLHNPTRNRF